MKWLILLLLVIITVVLGTWGLANLEGYFLIMLGGWQVENTNLAALLVLLALSYVAIWLVVSLVRSAWKLPDNMSAYSIKRKQKAAHGTLNQGLIDLIECRWQNAEKHLLANVDYSETPLLNYLGAARAAAQQNRFEHRDQYLRAAHEIGDKGNKADIAILLTQADLQLSHHQTEQALATLSRLRQIAPRHGYVLKLLSRLHHQLREWDKLARILPELKKSNVLTPEQLESLELDTYKGILEDAAKNHVDKTLSDAWGSLPKVLQKDSRLSAVYASALISQGDHEEAEKRLRTCLNKHWDEHLALLYGQLKLKDNSQALAHAEAWESKQPDSPALMMSLARLNKNERLWGKAEDYYRRLIKLAPSVDAYSELADMLDNLGKREEAASLYKAGIKLSVKS